MKKNLLNNLYIKTSLNLKIKKINHKIYIENKSNKREKIIFINLIKPRGSKIMLKNRIKLLQGEPCEVKFLTKRLRVFERTSQNSTTQLNQELKKSFFIGISFEPNSKYEISELSYDLFAKNEELENHFKNDILVVTTGYPSDSDKYNTSFVHTRVQEYLKNKISVDVAVVNDLYINKNVFYTFEGINVCCMGYNQLRLLLLEKKYKKILIHFIKPAFLRILDAVDITNTQVLLYTHGVDTLYHEYENIGKPYNVTKYEIPDWIKLTVDERDELIKRFNKRDNIKFVFGSKWNLKRAESQIGIKFNNAEIIPSFIDNKLYTYKPLNPELRKKIFIIRPQNNLKSYSMDINVRVILELSRRACFNDLEFSIYGTGSEHNWIIEPLKKFKNVHIYNKYLTHDEIAKMHKQNGIGLFASRFDSMGVSACEAAMSGNIVITSKGIGTEEYIDPKIGTYCNTENYIEYANLIEKIYNNPKLFSELSKKMHDSVMNTCSYDMSIKKDLKLISDFNKKEEFIIPSIKKNPLLSISIAGYNISKFVIQIFTSLLRSKYSDELEILLVNDGSKDDTIKKAQAFVDKYYKDDKNPIIRIIDKPNGGHGSTINKGLELATGKYFKLLDGDDYYISEQLDELIEKLKTNKADLVLTDYLNDFSVSGSQEISNYCTSLTPGVIYNLDDCCYDGYGFSGAIKWGPQLHTATYKTNILKEAKFKIDEHCFYVDMEYNLFGLICSDTIVYYPLHIYSYYIGREDQSVSKKSYIKNVKMHEKVCLRLIDEYYSRNISIGKAKNIRENMIVPLCKMQYEIVTELFKNPKNFWSFNKKLKKYPEFYNCPNIAGRKVKLYRLSKGLLIPFSKLINKLGRK